MAKENKVQYSATVKIMEPTSGKWWQTTEYEIHKCKWTNNKLYINRSDIKIFIMPHLNHNDVILCAKEALIGISDKFKAYPGNYPADKRGIIENNLNCIISNPAIVNIGLLIETVCEHIHGEVGFRTGNWYLKHVLIYILYHFRHHNIIALTKEELYTINRLSVINMPWLCTGVGHDVFCIIHKYDAIGGKGNHPAFKKLCSVTNSASPVDFDDDLLKKIITKDNKTLDIKGNGSFFSALCRSIVNIDPKIQVNYNKLLGKTSPSNNILHGIPIDESLRRWAALGIDFYKCGNISMATKRRGIRAFINHLIENPHISREPRDYFDKKIKIDPLFDSDNKSAYREVYCFLQWTFEQICCVTGDEDGEIHNLDPKKWANPQARPTGYGRLANGKTVREVMPAHLIIACKEILLANDFEWPKSITTDWFTNESGDRIWSPVRTVAILMKLCIPLRNKQLLTLSSGEGDVYRYEADGRYDLAIGPTSGQFVLNTGRNAPKNAKVLIQEGMFRKVPRWGGGFACHIFTNNNKTADRNKVLSANGYVMPWEHLEALGYALYLRDWQERENPTNDRICWDEVEWLRKDKEFHVMKKKHDYFLFRDPSNIKHPNRFHPCTVARLTIFWNLLIDELGRRMNILEGTQDNPSPHDFISTRDDRGRVASPKWDLHSLRVTILSYLHDEGVPLEFIAAIAGHQSIQMASYYSVIDPEKLASALGEATAKWLGKTVAEWTTHLRGVERQKVRDLLVAQDEAILDRVFEGDREGLVCMDHGLCLVGQSMCHEGLETLDENGQRIYQAVPGGKSNCVRCRYFATGPAWIMGLIAHFAFLTERLRKESRWLGPIEAEYKRQEEEFLRCLRECKPFTEHGNLERASTSYESANAKTNEVGHSWQATYILIEQAQELIRREREKPSDGMSLIVQGGIEAMSFALRKCHQTDSLAQICENANLYPVVSRPDEANQDLCCCLDRMLFNNGIPGLLVTLDGDQKRVTALEIYKWIKQRTRTDEEYADVVDCRTTLESLGFRFAFLEKLSTLEPFSLHLTELKAIRVSEVTPPRVNGRRTKALSMRKDGGHGEEC